MNFTMTKIAAAAVLAFAATGAHAGIGDGSVSSGGSFIMNTGGGLDQSGVAGGGTPVGSDSTIAGFVNQDAGTWGVSSTTPFFGGIWTASNGQLIAGAGSYSLDTATGALSSIASPTVANDGDIQFTVGANQMGGMIDFAWGTTTGIKVVNVWDVNADGSLTSAIVPGMENGPFPGYNANFNLTAANLVTPVPEASTYGMMLAGLGLVGFAVRRRKLMA